MRGLLEHRGYQIVRYFHLMAVELPAPHRAPHAVPEGYRLRAPGAEDEAAVHRVHTAAFADHWGSAPMSPQKWHDFWTARSNRMEHSAVVLDGAGEVVAYALTAEWVPQEAYLSILGSDPAHRGRGLAAAALGAVLDSATRAGFSKADLHVDSASPTGATRLYEKVGFSVRSTSATYRRDVPDAVPTSAG